MLELTEKEKEVVELALDLYSRVCMGQVNALAWAYRNRQIKLDDSLSDLLMVDAACDKLKSEMFAELDDNASYGIFHESVHPNACIAVGVIQKLHGKYGSWKDLETYAKKLDKITD